MDVANIRSYTPLCGRSVDTRHLRLAVLPDERLGEEAAVRSDRNANE